MKQKKYLQNIHNDFTKQHNALSLVRIMYIDLSLQIIACINAQFSGNQSDNYLQKLALSLTDLKLVTAGVTKIKSRMSFKYMYCVQW